MDTEEKTIFTILILVHAKHTFNNKVICTCRKALRDMNNTMYFYLLVEGQFSKKTKSITQQ